VKGYKLTVYYTYLEQQMQNLQDLQVLEELVYHKASLSSHSEDVQLVIGLGTVGAESLCCAESLCPSTFTSYF
jgi:hypothetical protein